MGCASSKHMIAATGDNSLNQPRGPLANSVRTDAVILKDLPEVVEKVIDVLKETDSEAGHGNSKDFNISQELESSVYNVAAEITDKNIAIDSNSESSVQGVVQGFFADDSSSNSKLSVQEGDEDYYKRKRNSPSLSADVDSLRTSSPESEIEQALANINDQNPPTPKPTFAELQELAIYPINKCLKVDQEAMSSICENPKLISNSNKLEQSITIVLKQPTEWEKQADMLANTQKYNPIDAMRKFRKENRSSSSLPHRGDLKPRTQRYFEEDLSDFFPMQSPLRSSISSAKSERDEKQNSHEVESNGIITVVKNDVPNKKIQASKFIKPTDNKRKENNTLRLQNGGVPSPSLYKVRERCAVCCNKYKH